MQNKKKIFYVILIFLFIFLCFSSNTFAVSDKETTEFDSKYITYIKNLPEYKQYKYYLCKFFDGDNMHNIDCYFFNDPDVYFYLGSLHGKDVLYANKYFDCYHASIRMEDTYFLGGNFRNTNIGSYICPLNDNKYPIFSNVCIYEDNTLTNFFFHIAEIPAITEVTQIPMIVITVMKMMLPICLIVFGILLVIWLVKSVILHMT